MTAQSESEGTSVIKPKMVAPTSSLKVYGSLHKADLLILICLKYVKCTNNFMETLLLMNGLAVGSLIILLCLSVKGFMKEKGNTMKKKFP